MSNNFLPGLAFSKAMKKKLPSGEKVDLDKSMQKLWDKSSAICALCDYPLPTDPKSIEVDHIIPEADKGPTNLANLQLACKTCNRSKQALPNNVAVPIIKMESWCKKQSNPSFDDVLQKYGLTPKNVKIVIKNQIPTLHFDSGAITGSQIGTDLASGIEYFYCEVPTDYIHNDSQVQPRMIQHKHVRKIMRSVGKGPLHEPSNCRAIHQSGDIYKLLQFDGQHKATAQIAMGKNTVQMKIYLGLTVPVANALVITIQKTVKKKALSQSDTMAKLNDVMGEALDNYKVPAGSERTEKGFIESYPKHEQTTMKNRLFDNLIGIVARSDTNLMYEYYQTSQNGAFDKNVDPVMDSNLMNHIIKPLLHRKPLESDMDDPVVYFRDAERKNIIHVLDAIYTNVIKDNWKNQPASTSTSEAKVKNFFQQAGLTMMMSVFKQMIEMKITPTSTGSYFLKDWNNDDVENVGKSIKAIFLNPIWTTKNPVVTALWNSNKGADLIAAAASEFNLGKVFTAFQTL
jgi:hypothetical protein